jgi:hypothetical protein
MADNEGPKITPSGESTWQLAPSHFRGDRIGPYRILEKIGEGGMGVVYVAEQMEPVRRRVALFCYVHWLGSADRRAQSRDLLEQVSASDDSLIRVDARCSREDYTRWDAL